MRRSVLTALILGLVAAASAQLAFGPGDTVWTRRYNGPGADFDYVTAMATDADGNVYVTGYSPGAGTANDYATVKYDSTGQQLWVARYAGSSWADDVPFALALDNSGNVYVTGQSGIYPDYNIVTVKYTAAGGQDWVATWSGPDNGPDAGTAIAVNPSTGEVWVTGYTTDAASKTDIITVKYTALGAQDWSQLYGDSENDRANAIGIDAAGNCYITGYTYTGNTELENYVTVKYSSGGAQLWAQTYNSTFNCTDEALAMAVDASGNVFVTGRSNTARPPGGNWDMATLKYDTDGNQGWLTRYTGVGRDDLPVAMKLDRNGNPVIVGSSKRAAGDYDCVTIKYNSSNGSEAWNARYNSSFNKDDVGAALVIDSLGQVHVVGSSMGSGSTYDYLILRYSATGGQDWATRFDSPARNDDQGVGIGLDRRLNVYVSGSSFGGVTPMGYDYLTVKFQAGGGGGVAEHQPAIAGRTLRLRPNPARYAASVSYQLSRPGTVRIELIDPTGRQAIEPIQGLRPAGENSERLLLNGLPAGVYLVRVTTPDRTFHGRIVVE
ncbi:MAG: SBBP repeat-containing protein [candidate division WOR-3 bacterium]